MTSENFFRIVIRWAVLMDFVVAGLLLIAGTTRLPLLNAYIVVMALSLLGMMLTIAPQLAQERGSVDDAKADIRVRLALLILFLATIVLATLDVGSIHLTNNVPMALSIITLAVVSAASGFEAWAIRVNSFYSPIVHIQAEQGHNVITHGPYRFLRHPAYFANIVAALASALAIGSWMALIPAILFSAVTFERARREDTFLNQNLPGYSAYMRYVPGGVLPRLPTRQYFGVNR